MDIIFQQIRQNTRAPMSQEKMEPRSGPIETRKENQAPDCKSKSNNDAVFKACQAGLNLSSFDKTDIVGKYQSKYSQT